MHHNISIFIITYNEEKDILKCLDSVIWSNDVVILDSFSTDETLAIANNFNNVRTFQKKFDDYSTQRNHGLKKIKFKNEWVLILDADETCSENLKEELLSSKFKNDKDTIVYSLRRKTFFANKWLKHNSMYNVWIDRLVRPEYVSFYGRVHEKLHYDGISKKLSYDINHYSFSKGIDHWLSRRNNFSTLSAEYETNNGYKLSIKNFYSKDPVKFRQFLNAVYRKLPFRWVIFFMYNFFIKLCFLDGVRGIQYVALETYYEFLIVCKINYKGYMK